MNQSEQHRTFAAALLKQDPMIGESQFKEYRMQLEQKLAQATRSERRMRLLTIAAWAVATLLPLGIVVVDRIQRGMTPLPPMRLALPLEVHAAPGVIGNVAAIVYMVTVAGAWILLLLYLVRWRPSFRRAREEHQTVLLADLQRQLTEVKQQLSSDSQ